MRGFIVFIIICLLAISLADLSSQTFKDNIEDVYQKQGTRGWGDIFSRFFNRKVFKKSYALVIGIGDYQQGWTKIESPYYDALRVRDFLIDDAGFDYVVTLTNSKATKQKINKLMEETFPNLFHANDKFLFYFSGHGTQRVVGEVAFGYLVLQNCSLKSYGGMITMDDIERWDRILYQNRHVLFILDCCFSGLAGQQRKSPLMDKKLARLSQYAHHIITAGTATEESVASVKKWKGSLFTDSFLKAAAGRADLSSRDFEIDGVVSLKEMMKYIGDRIDAESVKIKSRNPLSKGIEMSPQISDLQDNEGEFFFITKHIKNQKSGNDPDTALDHGWPVESKGDAIVKRPQLGRKPDLKAIESKTRRVYENHKGFWEADFDEGIVMVYIPPGSFVMGYENGSEDEKPEHMVNLDGYWIGMYEITFAQFRRFVMSTGYVTDAEKEGGPFIFDGDKWENDDYRSWEDTGYFDEDTENSYNHPVVCVSWNDCIAYAMWLSQKTGVRFSLPTEAQWEMAARGTDGRKYPWGNDSIAIPRTPPQEGYIMGTVMNEEGLGLLPGVTIELYSYTAGRVRLEISDVGGYFKFNKLIPLEDYVLEASLPGFKTLKMTNIPARSSAISRVDLVLEMGSIEEKVVQAQVFDRNMFLENVQKSRANFADLQFWFKFRKEWSNKNFDDGYFITAVVGSFFDGDSPYGIMDMGGNVWEWCHDLYERNFYSKSPALNPKGPSYGSTRIIRGGGWNSNVDDIRASNRDSKKPSYSSDFLGFRLVMTEK